MASKAMSAKSKPTPKKPSAEKAKKAPTTRARAVKAKGAIENSMPRATSSMDDSDVLLSGGARAGTVFGRCGGRILSSRIEQQVCDMLSASGVTHSHAPRHFEVTYEDKTVAAYAPMIVLRVRGRAGKTVVVEAADRVDAGTLGKICAFRRQYGIEFYVCMIAPEDVLDDLPLDSYDEAASTDFAQNLISRLAE